MTKFTPEIEPAFFSDAYYISLTLRNTVALCLWLIIGLVFGVVPLSCKKLNLETLPTRRVAAINLCTVEYLAGIALEIPISDLCG